MNDDDDDKNKKVIFYLRKISDNEKEVILFGVHKKKKIKITIQNYFSYHFHPDDSNEGKENEKIINLRFLINKSESLRVIQCNQVDCTKKPIIRDELSLSEFFLHNHQLTCMSFVQIEFKENVFKNEDLSIFYDKILKIHTIDDESYKPIYNISTLVCFNISNIENTITDVIIFTNSYSVKNGVSEKFRVTKKHFKLNLNVPNQKKKLEVSLKKNYYKKKREFSEEQEFIEAILEFLDDSDVIFENDYTFKNNGVKDLLKKAISHPNVIKKYPWIRKDGTIDIFLTKHLILHNFIKKEEKGTKKSENILEYVSIFSSKNIPFLSISELEKSLVIGKEKAINYLFSVIIVHFDELEKLFLIETYDNMKSHTGFIFNYRFEIIPLFNHLITKKIFSLRLSNQKDKNCYWIFKSSRQFKTKEKVLYGDLDKLKGFHKDVLILDFDAFYPSIAILFGLCSSNTTTEDTSNESFVPFKGSENECLIPNIFAELLEKRNFNKKNGNYTKEKCYKTLSNSFYGFWAAKKNPLRFPSLSQKIIDASKYVKKIVLDHISQKQKLKCILSNYDGFFIQFNETDNFKIDSDILLKELNQKLANTFGSEIIRLKIDKKCKKIFFLHANKYIYRVDTDDTNDMGIVFSKGFEFENQFLNYYIDSMNYIIMEDDYNIETLEKIFYLHYCTIKWVHEKNMKIEYIFEDDQKNVGKEKEKFNIFKTKNSKNFLDEYSKKITEITLRYYEIIMDEKNFNYRKERLERMKIQYTPTAYKKKVREDLNSYVIKNFLTVLEKDKILEVSGFLKKIHYPTGSRKKHKVEVNKTDEKNFIIENMKKICNSCSRDFYPTLKSDGDLINSPSECSNNSCVIKKKFNLINF